MNRTQNFSHIRKLITRYITNMLTTNPKNSKLIIDFFSLFLFVRYSSFLLAT